MIYCKACYLFVDRLGCVSPFATLQAQRIQSAFWVHQSGYLEFLREKCYMGTGNQK
jgi:hypothetical protein